MVDVIGLNVSKSQNFTVLYINSSAVLKTDTDMHAKIPVHTGGGQD